MKILQVALLLLASSVAHALDSECRSGDKCSLEGVLRIYRTASIYTFVLETGTSCVAIALPWPEPRDYKKWENKAVLVLGTAYSRSDIAEVFRKSKLNGLSGGSDVCTDNPFVLVADELTLKE